VSCAKTAEAIDMQFGMLSRVFQGGNIYNLGVDSPKGSSTFLGDYGRLKRIVKHMILRLV